MISVIVPVYNVEPYLRKCLNSIINQTCKDLEILIIDDGSTDGSGIICDEYKKDTRVRVFHTDNRGLSSARNLGLDNATGDWIGFIDSDDWIEPDMYEALLRKAEESGADVVECGVFIDYISEIIKSPAIAETVCETEALEALVRHKIRDQVWNKLWKAQHFADIRFPEGRNFEDISTVYKVIRNAKITGINNFCYHWIQRTSSISNVHDRKNLEDGWKAHKQRYDDLKDCVGNEEEVFLLIKCAQTIARTWAWSFKCNCSPEILKEMNEFVIRNYPFDRIREKPKNLRVCLFLAQFNNRASFMAAYVLNQIHRTLKSTLNERKFYN